jgi:hypothetical protein
MEVQHTNFSKVTGMEFVKENTVMMLTTCKTATTRMFSVFTNSTVTGTFVTSLLTVLV